VGKGKVGFGDGVSALINGFRHLSHPTLRAWVIWPILINLAVFAGLAWLLTGWLTGSIQDVMDGLPEWLNFLRWIMWVLAVLMMALVFGVSFTTLTLLIGAPFYVVLTRRAMTLVSVEPFPSANTSFTAIVQETASAVLRELSKIRRFIPWLLLALVISFIPVINVLAPIVWLLVNSWIFAFQFVDYPIDARERPITETREWLAEHRAAAFGVGAGVALCASVPFLNVVAFPSAIIGACQLVESSRSG
jgi:CysZ protein